MDNVKEIKKAVETGTALLGTEVTMKVARAGKLTKVFLSSNCPEDVKAEVMKLSEIREFPVETLKLPNDELGVVCKKPYSISIIGIKG